MQDVDYAPVEEKASLGDTPTRKASLGDTPTRKTPTRRTRLGPPLRRKVAARLRRHRRRAGRAYAIPHSRSTANSSLCSSGPAQIAAAGPRGPPIMSLVEQITMSGVVLDGLSAGRGAPRGRVLNHIRRLRIRMELIPRH